MPLVAMNEYVDRMEDLKASMGYGLPKQYPLALNGLGEEKIENPFRSFKLPAVGQRKPNTSSVDLFRYSKPSDSTTNSEGNFIIQKEPDYTTYAVIGGAVIVASVLAIAVGRSGRR